jgi:hypothetical protein
VHLARKVPAGRWYLVGELFKDDSIIAQALEGVKVPFSHPFSNWKRQPLELTCRGSKDQWELLDLHFTDDVLADLRQVVMVSGDTCPQGTSNARHVANLAGLDHSWPDCARAKKTRWITSTTDFPDLPMG